MNFLFLTSTLPRTPADPEPRFMLDLAIAVQRQGHTVRILAPAWPGSPEQFELSGIPVHTFAYAPARFEHLAYQGGMPAQLRQHPWKWLLVPAFVLAQTLAIRKLLRTHTFEHILGGWILPQGLSLRLLHPKVPYSIWCLGADLTTLQQRPLQRLKQWILSRAHSVFTVADFMQRTVITQYKQSPKKVRTLSTGVNQTAFQVPQPCPAVYTTPQRILFVGRLDHKKGVDLLLQLPTDFPLYIIGRGSEEARYRSLAKNNVHFLGAIPHSQLPAYLQHASLLVVPSRVGHGGDMEGRPTVISEALACGTPVVGTSLPGIAELLTPHNGILVEPENPQALQHAILQALSNPWLPAQIRASVAPRDWSALAAQFITDITE